MDKYAVAKVFMGGNGDLILSGNAKLVDKYINDLYKEECLLDDDIEFDKDEYYDKCEYCESLMSNGDMEECPVLVTSHEKTESEEEYEEILEYYREDMPWAEVINLF